MKTVEYLAAIKAKYSLTSDYKLSKLLKLPPNLVSKYQQGKNVPGPLTAFKIAELLGEQPAAVIADLETERAEKMGKEDDAHEWHEIVRRLAASILLVVGVGGFPNADARLAQSGDSTGTHIVLRGKGKRQRRSSSVIQQSAAA